LAKNKNIYNFRDRLTTSGQDGKRVWLYPEIVSGRWFVRRAWVAYGLLACLLAGPFLEWNDHPLFLFDVLNRNFIVWGIAFTPQDNVLFVLAILTFFVFIFAFTNAFGRLWCGWACPQTIFLEWIFRPIERLIEGNASARRRLDAMAAGPGKNLRKVLKFVVFFLISFLLANVFLAYVIGKNELLKIVIDSPLNHLGGLSALLIFTLVFFFIYTRLRELACTFICPYGRLQGTLLDKNTMAVAYDFIRGEPRGHVRQEAESKVGDCVDCNWCVKVCPTGIDIRNGSQMECIQCTACIDACDAVMEKTGRKKNLIGYFSENELNRKYAFSIRPKGIAYFSLWFLLFSILGVLLWQRAPVETILLRTPGNTGMVNSPGFVANLYNFELVNKTFEDQEITFKSLDNNIKITWVGKPGFTIEKGAVRKGSFFLEIPGEAGLSKTAAVEIEVLANGKPAEVIKTRFFYLPQKP